MSVKKNSLVNFIGAGIPLLLTLITLPFYIREIGEERFAFISIAWIILGYFGFFDLGLTQATAMEIAKTKDQESIKRADIYCAALLTNGFFGLIGGLFAWLGAYFFFSYHFITSTELRFEIIGALPWLALAVPIATISGVQIGFLQGREKFLTISKITIVGSFLIQALPLLTAIALSASLEVILPITVLSRVVVLALLTISVNTDLPVISGRNFKLSVAKKLLRFGGWVTVSAIISPVLTTFDRFLIGSIVGAKAVAYYTVSYNLASRVSIFPSSLTTALFPKLSSADSIHRRTYTRDAIIALTVIMLPILAFGILNFKEFLKAWMSPDFSLHAGGVGAIILLGMFFNSLARIPYVALQADGRPDIVAKCHIIEVIPYCAFLYYGTLEFGILGAACVWTIRSCIDAILLFYFHGIEWKILFPAFIATGLLLALTIHSLSGERHEGVSLLILNFIVMPSVAYWCWLTMKRQKRSAEREKQ